MMQLSPVSTRTNTLLPYTTLFRSSALTRKIRVGGASHGVIAHNAKGEFDVEALLRKARKWPGLEGMDLAKEVSFRQMFRWSQGLWRLGQGYVGSPSRLREGLGAGLHVVAFDHGSKRNIFPHLADSCPRVTVLTA